MMKKISMMLLAFVMTAAMAMGCYAAGDTIIYDGTALDCSEVAMEGFDGMIPGIPSSGSITLVNESKKNTNFYMSTKVINTLVSGLQPVNNVQSGYTVTLEANDVVLFGYDPAAETLTGTLVGGDEQTDMSVGGLKEWTQSEDMELIGMCKPGEEIVIKMTILPDGTTLNDNFQKAAGEVNFIFAASDAQTGYVQLPDEIVTVKTGDNSMMLVFGGVMLTAVVLLVVLKRKKKED